jgi:hypothetical protein
MLTSVGPQSNDWDEESGVFFLVHHILIAPVYRYDASVADKKTAISVNDL